MDGSRTPPPRSHARWTRLARKELRETLRDRRTLVTLVLMPLLVYPLLSITFNRFLTAMRPAQGEMWVIAVQPSEAVDAVQELLEEGERLVLQRRRSDGVVGPPHPRVSLNAVADARTAVRELEATVGIEVTPPAVPTGPPRWNLLYRDGESTSAAALSFVERRLAAVNEQSWRTRLQRLGIPDRPVVASRPVALARPRTTTLSLAMLVPLILILMTITGAVYPAIDLTAGERERGTLEMLIASPAPAYQLLLAKYVAVVTVAVLTALVNLAAMGMTLTVSGLGRALFGTSGPSPMGVALVVALTFLFAAFFSALLLAITGMARSFKEAQAYLIPVMLLAISPGMMTMMPQLQLNGWLSVVPLVNTALLAREALSGEAEIFWIAVVVVTDILYAVGALAIAARVFGAEAGIAVTHGQWRDLWRRPSRASDQPAWSHGLVVLAGAFLMQYLFGNVAILTSGHSIHRLLWANAGVTLVVFAAWPTVLALHRRIRLRTTFALERPPWFAFVGAVLLGVSLWPWAYELYRLAEAVGMAPLGQSRLRQMEQLMEGLKTVSPWVIFVALAVVPALAEEWFFRGFVLSWLRARMRVGTAVLASALLFGAFHVFSPTMLSPERFLPTTLLGLVLGWLCVRTRSLWPGVVVHLVHNGLLPWIVLHQRQWEWLWSQGSGEGTPSIAPLWLGVALMCNLVGLALIFLWTRGRRPRRVPDASRVS